jgi:hypothetical protein
VTLEDAAIVVAYSARSAGPGTLRWSRGRAGSWSAAGDRLVDRRILASEMLAADLWPALSLGLVFAAPWIIAILWNWHKRPRDAAVPPSLAETVRKRLWM